MIYPAAAFCGPAPGNVPRVSSAHSARGFTYRLRRATPGDTAALLGLVQALADYEREPQAVMATEADFHAALFPSGDEPRVFAHVAEHEGTVVGMALWFLTFSTWTGRHGIWLEDLYVVPDHRGRGLGRRLVAILAAVCADRGYPRLDWSVLDWNQPSLAFYRSLGACAMDEWTQQRLEGVPLGRLAAEGRE